MASFAGFSRVFAPLECRLRLGTLRHFNPINCSQVREFFCVWKIRRDEKGKSGLKEYTISLRVEERGRSSLPVLY